VNSFATGAGLPGCRLYLVNRALDDPQAIWVMELWDDQAAHDASLQDEGVRALIAEARPLVGGAPDGAALELLGGAWFVGELMPRQGLPAIDTTRTIGYPVRNLPLE
jgi:hypothetical protein